MNTKEHKIQDTWSDKTSDTQVRPGRHNSDEYRAQEPGITRGQQNKSDKAEE